MAKSKSRTFIEVFLGDSVVHFGEVTDQRVGPGQSSSVKLEDGGDLVGVRGGYQMVGGPFVGIAKF